MSTLINLDISNFSCMLHKVFLRPSSCCSCIRKISPAALRAQNGTMPSTVSYPSITSNQPNDQSINQPMNQSNHQSIQYNAMAMEQSLSKISIINSKLIKNKNNSPQKWEFATAASKARARCGHSAPMSCSYWSFPIQCCCWDLMLSWGWVKTLVPSEPQNSW